MNGNDIIIGTMSGSTFTALAAVKGHEIQSGADVIEKASATQQDWKEHIAGRKEWGVSMNYLVLGNARTNVRDVLKVGTTYVLRVKDRAGNYSITGSAICTQCRQTYNRGNIVVGSFAFKGNGELW